MKYRSRMDIAAAILKGAQGGSRTTKLVYGSFTSHQQCKEYITLLTDQGLLNHNKTENTYTTTNKGEWFLRIYEEINQMIKTSGEGQSRIPPSHTDSNSSLSVEQDLPIPDPASAMK